jgi:alpha-1,2-mannosyltransferase
MVGLAVLAAVYMYTQAHNEWDAIAHVNGLGGDFHGTIWNPDRAILHGRSPYPPSGHITTVGPPPAVYLPPIFLVTLPLGLLSLHVANWVWFGILVCSTIATVAALGVRNPLCYALWGLSLPVVAALALGNATLLVALGAALTWRFRDRRVLGPLTAAATVSIKLWLWPLLAWLLITRPRAGARSGAALVSITACAWAVIRFDGLFDYPKLMHAEARQFVQTSVLLIAALSLLHVAVQAAAAIGIALGVALLALAFVWRRRDLDSYALALLAALVATPVAWDHYLVLPAIPLAIAWRSLSISWVWFPAMYLVLRSVARVPSHGLPLHDFACCLFAAAAAALVVVAGGSGGRSVAARSGGSRAFS